MCAGQLVAAIRTSQICERPLAAPSPVAAPDPPVPRACHGAVPFGKVPLPVAAAHGPGPSRMRSATTPPDTNVSAAIEAIAQVSPNRSAIRPAASAPMA